MRSYEPGKNFAPPIPPMPHFVGSWQVVGDTQESGILANLRRRTRAIATRVHAALGFLLGVEPVRPVPSVADPLPRMEFGGTPAPDRVVLPMSSGMRVKQDHRVCISSRPQNVAFRPERIVVGGSPADWIIHDIKVGRHSQLCGSGDLPGEAFAADAEVEVRLDTVATAQDFAVEVTYVGPDPEGAPFACGVIGSAGLLDEVDTNRIYLPLSSSVNIPPNTSAEIHASPQDPFRAERIIIGSPENWVVNDIKVGGRSQIAQSGDIPGVAFSATSAGTEISFETAQIGMRFSLLVTYIGDKTEGEPLLACAIGSVPA